MTARVNDRLGTFITGKQFAAGQAITQALILGASEASVMTPIDTSTLINSQYRSVSNDGSEVRGRVGYTAEYAVPVHDPDVKQNFRRETAEKEFLLKGFERAKPAIDAVIAKAMKA